MSPESEILFTFIFPCTAQQTRASNCRQDNNKVLMKKRKNKKCRGKKEGPACYLVISPEVRRSAGRMCGCNMYVDGKRIKGRVLCTLCIKSLPNNSIPLSSREWTTSLAQFNKKLLPNDIFLLIHSTNPSRAIYLSTKVALIKHYYYQTARGAVRSDDRFVSTSYASSLVPIHSRIHTLLDEFWIERKMSIKSIRATISP